MGTPFLARIIEDVDLELKSLEIVYRSNGAAVEGLSDRSGHRRNLVGKGKSVSCRGARTKGEGREFLIIQNSGSKEELTYLPSFHMTQRQQITVEEHLFDDFVLATLTFGPCTTTTDTFPFTYQIPSVPTSISEPLNCSPI